MAKRSLAGLTLPELEKILSEDGLPKYTAKQVIKWVFEKNIFDMHMMSDIAAKDRLKIMEQISVMSISPLKQQISSEDKTEKILFKTEDQQTFEMVILKDRKRTTLCLSSQIGCKMDCLFCATGQAGFVRNLNTAEIVEQYLFASQKHIVDNVVFMGMGEPLDNYDNVIKAIRILQTNAKFSPRRITLSTVGLIHQIKKLIKEDLPITLAVSLNASNDSSRQGMIPSAKKFKIKDIISSLHEYTKVTGRRATIEYVLFDKINDQEKDARAVIKLLQDLNCNINLIQYNSVDKLHFTASPNSQANQFKYWLEQSGREVTIRFRRGRDIDAACGQLRQRTT
jgi:23S rRNA (adenine2503-C2)-methyltransferase